MQIPIWLLHSLKSGEASVLIDGIETIQLRIENKKIDINLQNKKFVKDVLKVEVEPEKKSILKKVQQLKDIAEELKKEELTVTFSHKGCAMLKLGAEARPKLLRLVTLSKAIEINNMGKLIQLIKDLR